jgi:pimeloyl-ACP methyl ester carboxylesterase
VARIARVAREQLPQGAPLIGMGHSFGAQLTVLLAAHEPGLFKALVLTDPILFPLDKWLAIRALALLGQHPFAKGARRRRDRWPARAAAAEHLRGRGIYRGWSEEAFQCFVDHAMEESGGEWVLRCPREIEAEIFEQPAWPWGAFRRIEVPILFLRGAQSYPFFPQAERWALRHNPRVTVQQLPGGHCFMQEDPAAAHAAVAAFLARL